MWLTNTAHGVSSDPIEDGWSLSGSACVTTILTWSDGAMAKLKWVNKLLGARVRSSVHFGWVSGLLMGLCCVSPGSAYAAQQSNGPASDGIELPYANAVITKRPFVADERMNVAMPDHPVELAQPIDILITFTRDDVVSLSVEQHDSTYIFDNQSKGIPVGSGDAKIVQDNGVTKTIELIPLQTGVLYVDFDALFTDGGMSHKTYQLSVVASSKGLKKFYLNHDSHVLALVLEDKDEDRQMWLDPEVYYAKLDDPIYLSSSSQIKFTVEQSEDNPVIRLDGNGMVHALCTGKAKIIANFDGVKDSVVVTVCTKESAPPGYRRVLDSPVP